MLKLVELDNSHKSKGGRLDTLHWLYPFFTSFIGRYNDLVIVDGIRKSNIYDLRLVVTTVINY